MPPRLSARALLWSGVLLIGVFGALWLRTSSVAWTPEQFDWLSQPQVNLLFWGQTVVGQVGAALVAASLLVATLGSPRTVTPQVQRGFPPRLSAGRLLGSAVVLFVAPGAFQVVWAASLSVQNWYNQLPSAIFALVSATFSLAGWLAVGLTAAAFAVRALELVASGSASVPAP